MSQPRVVLVVKRSSYTRFVEDEHDPRARSLLARRDPSVARWREAHRDHLATLGATERALDRLGARVVKIERAHAAFDTADAALVVVVGGDGTLLAASKNVSGCPVLGVNSAPKHSVGFFCAAQRRTVAAMLERALDGTLRHVVLQRMSVTLNGRVRSRRVLNEVLYCHSSPAATSRYLLSVGRTTEEQRSSGLWVGPAAGSTAAQRSAGGRVLPLQSRALQLVVREPYEPAGRRYALRRALVPDGSSLRLVSKMQDAAMFLDGPETRLGVHLGDETVLAASDEPLTVLGLDARRK